MKVWVWRGPQDHRRTMIWILLENGHGVRIKADGRVEHFEPILVGGIVTTVLRNERHWEQIL